MEFGLFAKVRCSRAHTLTPREKKAAPEFEKTKYFEERRQMAFFIRNKLLFFLLFFPSMQQTFSEFLLFARFWVRNEEGKEGEWNKYKSK